MEYKRLQRAVTLLFCIIAFGTFGYYAVEHMTVLGILYDINYHQYGGIQ